MQATWEAVHIGKRLTEQEEAQGRKNAVTFHIFSVPAAASPAQEIPVSQVYDTGGSSTEVNGAVQKMMRREFLEKAKRKRDRGLTPKEEEEARGDGSSAETSGRLSDSRKSASSSFNKPIPAEILAKDPLLLNIGGTHRLPDWVSVNTQSFTGLYSDQVDIVRRMHNLVGLQNESVSAIYSR